MTYIDYDLRRLEIAEASGADAVQIPQKERRRRKWYRQEAPHRSGTYPITVDASARPDGLRYAIRSVAPGGTCTSVGFYFQKKTHLPLMQMYANDTTFHTGISHPRADLPEVLDLITTRKFQPEKVTTLLADWEDAPEAYLERTPKVVVHRASAFV